MRYGFLVVFKIVFCGVFMFYEINDFFHNYLKNHENQISRIRVWGQRIFL